MTSTPTVAESDQPPGIPTLADVQMHLHRPTEPAVGHVVETEICTKSKKAAGFVRHVAIDVSKTKLAGNFIPGQSFGVIPPGLDDKGKPHKVRLYSISSPVRGEDGHGNVLATTVKRTIDEHWDDHALFLGVASNFLCDLQPGDEVAVSGPAGKRFVLPANPGDHDYLFFATGTGIAPFRGMIADLLDPPDGSAPTSRITLVMGSPYSTDLLYDEQLRALDQQHERFTYLTAISREAQDDGNPRLYVQDRIATHADLIRPMLESHRTLVYVCGIAGMELGIFSKMAQTLGDDALDQYLRIDPDLRSQTDAWERRMINRQIKPTRRMFLEVY